VVKQTRTTTGRAKSPPTQGALPFHRDGKRGGNRPRSGRPKLAANRRKGGVPHTRRGKLAASRPIHVTVRLHKHSPSLRARRAYQQILRCFVAARDRFGFRLVHYSVQATHLHHVCEAKDRRALSRGMQGLLIRVAKAMNRLWGRKGSVWAERYHEHVLKSPRETRNALAYVLNNLWRHLRAAAPEHGPIDACASGRYFTGWRMDSGIPPPPTLPPSADPADPRAESQRPVADPHTWLLRAGWRRHGLIRFDEVPRGLTK
jgi:putative transposase